MLMHHGSIKGCRHIEMYMCTSTYTWLHTHRHTKYRGNCMQNKFRIGPTNIYMYIYKFNAYNHFGIYQRLRSVPDKNRFAEHSLIVESLTDNFKNHHKELYLIQMYIFIIKPSQCEKKLSVLWTQFIIIIQVQIANFLNHLNDESDYV